MKYWNRSLKEGIFPNEWKKAIVIPIPKKNKEHQK